MLGVAIPTNRAIAADKSLTWANGELSVMGPPGVSVLYVKGSGFRLLPSWAGTSRSNPTGLHIQLRAFDVNALSTALRQHAHLLRAFR
jgi:hypothetical protein